MMRLSAVDPEMLNMVAAEKVMPIRPRPEFRTNTVHMRVVQGGFMDDMNRWHAAPKRCKEAVRIGGYWYWAVNIRDRHGKMILSRQLLMPCA